MSLYRSNFEDKDLSVVISHLLVATADSSDALIDESVPDVLRLLRERMGMDAVFVSEFVNGQGVFRFVDTSSPFGLKAGDSNPLEATFCQRVVDGRLPERINDVNALPNRDQLPKPPFPLGAHLSTPVVLTDGRIYGTLCCFSHAPKPELQQRDLTQLRMCAQLVARKVETAMQNADTVTDPHSWTLEPISPTRR
jgi:GAF domain-containing protein